MRQLSPEHIAALIATAVAAGGLAVVARRRPGPWLVAASRSLAALILAAYVAEATVYALRGIWTVRVNLPLQLTDAVTLAAVAALWRPRPLLVELVWFWALSASLQAMLTPDLAYPFPDPLFFTYVTTHGGAVVAACLLVVGRGLHPRPGALWRVYAMTADVAALAAIGDLITGGNYMFLRARPAHPSLLDVMGDWPWYILSTAVFALVLFAALAALAAALRGRAEPYARPRRGAVPNT